MLFEKTKKKRISKCVASTGRRKTGTNCKRAAHDSHNVLYIGVSAARIDVVTSVQGTVVTEGRSSKVTGDESGNGSKEVTPTHLK